MDKKFYTQCKLAVSSPSTATELSQGLSPVRTNTQDTTNTQDEELSIPSLNKFFEEDCSNGSPRFLKKPIFKIIRDVKQSQQQKISVGLDSGNYSRKEKSLGELSRKLLVMFGKLEQCVISLDAVTQQLGVERRRIYDIINILESLGVVYRKGKNSYQWKGLKSIYATLKKLQHESLTTEDEISNEEISDEEDNQKSQNRVKREKSLGLLSTGFIKLFLSWKGIISLEQAGRKLSSDNIEENKIRTKIRRLYDIANVFSSLGLIRKTCLESKKPAYEWIGLGGLEAFIRRLNNSSDENEIFQEISSKKKEKPCVVQPKKQREKQQTFSIKSDNSAFKPHEAPISNSNTIDILLFTLLSLYRNNKINKTSEGANLQNILLTQNQNEHTNFAKSISNPPRLGGMGLVVPSTKKPVSIIQMGNDSNIGGKKAHGIQLGNAFSTASSFKRKPTQDISVFEGKTVKRIHTSNEFVATTKSLWIQNREN